MSKKYSGTMFATELYCVTVYLFNAHGHVQYNIDIYFYISVP